MTKENLNQQLSVACGKTTDTFETLKTLCEEKAKDLSRSIDFSLQSTVEVPFWTENFPELICVGKFTKDENGKISYKLDFSQSTL